MGKQLKLGIKMMRYGYGFKTSMVFVGFFIVVGILLSLIADAAPGGAFMIMVAGMWPVQVISSLCTANLVRSSSWKKSAETVLPALMSFFNFLAAYLIVFLTYLPRMAATDATGSTAAAADLIVVGVITAVMMVFCGMAYKYMVGATVIFFAAYLLVISFQNMFQLWFVENSTVPFWGGALIGLAMIVAGAIVEYAISCLTYKRPMSKSAQFAGLRKYM